MELNQIYTISYSQPEAYRFSLDSIFLSQRVNDWLIQQKIKPAEVADLCSGCGVVGLELLFHLTKRQSPPTQINFIEIQEDYISHFEKNKSKMQSLLGSITPMNLITDNYQNLINHPQHIQRYDLIICNPPYFHLGEGKLSPSNFKSRCRYFMDSDFFHLIKWVSRSLAQRGSAFILVRNSSSLAEICQKLKIASETIGDIRGTQLVRLFHEEPAY